MTQVIQMAESLTARDYRPVCQQFRYQELLCRITQFHRRRSSVNFRGGGTKFLPEKYVLKICKVPEFYMILARKIIKIPEFYDICPKNARILHNNFPKNIFPEF